MNESEASVVTARRARISRPCCSFHCCYCCSVLCDCLYITFLLVHQKRKDRKGEKVVWLSDATRVWARLDRHRCQSARLVTLSDWPLSIPGFHAPAATGCPRAYEQKSE